MDYQSSGKVCDSFENHLCNYHACIDIRTWRHWSNFKSCFYLHCGYFFVSCVALDYLLRDIHCWVNCFIESPQDIIKSSDLWSIIWICLITSLHSPLDHHSSTIYMYACSMYKTSAHEGWYRLSLYIWSTHIDLILISMIFVILNIDGTLLLVNKINGYEYTRAKDILRSIENENRCICFKFR